MTATFEQVCDDLQRAKVLISLLWQRGDAPTRLLIDRSTCGWLAAPASPAAGAEREAQTEREQVPAEVEFASAVLEMRLAVDEAVEDGHMHTHHLARLRAAAEQCDALESRITQPKGRV